jgi:pimeloyl-ACP methyl ester carboxylesterase
MSVEFVDVGAERLEVLRIAPDRTRPPLVFLHEGLGSVAGWRGFPRARVHDDPDGAFFGWNDGWLDPAFRQWNIEAELPRIRCPVLAIQGFDDQYGTMEQLDRIARGVPHARLLKLQRCGHAPQSDQPEQVSAAIAALYDEALGAEAFG